MSNFWVTRICFHDESIDDKRRGMVSLPHWSLLYHLLNQRFFFFSLYMYIKLNEGSPLWCCNKCGWTGCRCSWWQITVGMTQLELYTVFAIYTITNWFHTHGKCRYILIIMNRKVLQVYMFIRERKMSIGSKLAIFTI